MQAWQLNLKPKSANRPRMHEYAQVQEYQNVILLAAVYVANVYAFNRRQAFCSTGINKHTMHTTRQSIPTFLIVTDELKNAQQSNSVQLELFDPQVTFLTLTTIWRTIQILESHKQGGKSTRLHLAANQKTLT